MVLINGSQIQLPNDYQRNIEYISTKRIWGGVCRGEIYTFRKKIFLYEKDGSLMEKINFMALQSQLNTQTYKYGVFLVRVHQNKKKEMLLCFDPS